MLLWTFRSGLDERKLSYWVYVLEELSEAFCLSLDFPNFRKWAVLFQHVISPWAQKQLSQLPTQ